jgi:N-acetylglutamate synthase
LQSSREILIAIEQAAVRSWPALETAEVDGWLWRYASGGSLRANSVATLDFTGSSLEAAVADIERRYRARSAPCRLTLAEVSQPADLDERLGRLGYARGEDHVTMAKQVVPAAAMPDDVDLSADPTPEWMVVYLAGLGPDRRHIAPAILAGLPRPRAFLACRLEGAVVGSGLTIADGELASVQCMATLPAARRRGCAQSVLRAIEAWAAARGCRRLYLQTECANRAAIALYEGFGFHVAGRYHLRWKR